MQFLKLGATAIATGVIATLTMTAAAPAFAQKEPTLTRQVSGPLNEARTAIIAKDWATAKTKLDAATAAAKTPYDNVTIEKMRVIMASETKDTAQQIKSFEMMLGSGLLKPEEVKQYKGLVLNAYNAAGDTAKGNAALRDYLESYGGTPQQYTGLANGYIKAKDLANAEIYGNKAIEAFKTAGTPIPEVNYLVMMRIHQESKDMAKYYAVEEELALISPKEDYWKELIAGRVQEASDYGANVRLDMFRALQAANVQLSVNEKRIAGDSAVKRALYNEAVQLLEEGVNNGQLSDPIDKENLDAAKKALPNDKAGLAKEATQAESKKNGLALVNIGEAWLSHGDNAKAIELIQKGISAGGVSGAELDLAKVHLGIAQFRSGQADAARATWGEVTSNNAAGALAKNWILISKKPA